MCVWGLLCHCCVLALSRCRGVLTHGNCARGESGFDSRPEQDSWSGRAPPDACRLLVRCRVCVCPAAPPELLRPPTALLALEDAACGQGNAAASSNGPGARACVCVGGVLAVVCGLWAGQRGSKQQRTRCVGPVGRATRQPAATGQVGGARCWLWSVGCSNMRGRHSVSTSPVCCCCDAVVDTWMSRSPPPAWLYLTHPVWLTTLLCCAVLCR